MGQFVSTDADAMDLKDFLRLGRANAGTPVSQEGTTQGGFSGHHIKAWKFDSRGRGIMDSPVDLCDRGGTFSADFQKNFSYLILHVRAPKPAGDSEEESAAFQSSTATVSPDVLEDFRASAFASCTPRGLAVEVTSHDDSVAGSDGIIGCLAAALRYAVFVWHGFSVDPLVKAYTMGKAFELDRVLRHGLLRQPSFLEGLRRAVQVKGVSVPNKVRPEIPKDSKSPGRNRLLSSLFEGAQRGAQSVVSAGLGARSTGTHRFPHLGLSVCQSVNANGGNNSNTQRRQQVPTQPIFRFSGATSELGFAPASPSGIQAASAQPPAGTTRVGKAGILIPRLALGSLVPGNSVAPGPACQPVASPALTGPGSAAMDESGSDISADPRDGSDSKRFKGPDVFHPASTAREAQSQISTAASTTWVPQSARLAIPSFQAPQSLDTPGLLNLEEMHMSEEDLVNSFDPSNEENNYHLPPHQYRQLKLNHFKQVCSEVIPGKLFICSYQVASDVEKLKEHGITHVVNTAADICESKYPEHFQYLTYYLKDTNSECINVLFYKTLAWIDTAIESGGRVVVHCHQGVSRSATMIMAYLMWKLDLSFDAAHERIRKVRPICNPNTGFTCQLLLLGKKLCAGKGQVSGSPSSQRLMGATSLFRITPYHAKEPFLVLLPEEGVPTEPLLDPRFGWVVQHGAKLVVWMGSKLLDRQAAHNTAAQHAKWLDMFEGCSCTMATVEEGQEPADFWQLLGGIAGASASQVDQRQVVGVRQCFDIDHELLASLTDGQLNQADASEGLRHDFAT